jgi:hypothetical protein
MNSRRRAVTNGPLGGSYEATCREGSWYLDSDLEVTVVRTNATRVAKMATEARPQRFGRSAASRPTADSPGADSAGLAELRCEPTCQLPNPIHIPEQAWVGLPDITGACREHIVSLQGVPDDLTLTVLAQTSSRAGLNAHLCRQMANTGAPNCPDDASQSAGAVCRMLRWDCWPALLRGRTRRVRKPRDRGPPGQQELCD